MSNPKKVTGKVHVVLDYSQDRILGVYLTRRMAYGKVAKEKSKTMNLHENYAVLEFTVQGLNSWGSLMLSIHAANAGY